TAPFFSPFFSPSFFVGSVSCVRCSSPAARSDLYEKCRRNVAPSNAGVSPAAGSTRHSTLWTVNGPTCTLSSTISFDLTLRPSASVASTVGSPGPGASPHCSAVLAEMDTADAPESTTIVCVTLPLRVTGTCGVPPSSVLLIGDEMICCRWYLIFFSSSGHNCDGPSFTLGPGFSFSFASAALTAASAPTASYFVCPCSILSA